jgi:hypothetical protein
MFITMMMILMFLHLLMDKIKYKRYKKWTSMFLLQIYVILILE